jgi:translation initiation factor eIF-2B subunit beta
MKRAQKELVSTYIARESKKGALPGCSADSVPDSHIRAAGREIILTIGMSRTVLAFLKAAWKDRNFTVIVAETSPS